MRPPRRRGPSGYYGTYDSSGDTSSARRLQVMAYIIALVTRGADGRNTGTGIVETMEAQLYDERKYVYEYL